MRVSVIGGSRPAETDYETAVTLGRELGASGHDVVCGGLSGVMKGVAQGMGETEGEVIGILPGTDRAAANQYIDTVITTGMGSARNVLVVMNGEAAIAIDGSTGTLSEIAHALDLGRPVAGIRTHDVEGVIHVESPEKAVEWIETAVVK